MPGTTMACTLGRRGSRVTTAAARAQVFDAAVGAGADEDAVDWDRPRSACPACSSMYSSARSRRVAVGSDWPVGRIGHAAVDRTTCRDWFPR